MTTTFPMPRRSVYDPPAAYSEGPPVQEVELYDGRRVWLVRSHQLVREVLADPRYSADRARADFPFSSPARVALERFAIPFVAMDDPDHARIRRVFTKFFTVRRVEQLRGDIAGIVAAVVDELLASEPPVDFVRTVAVEVPGNVICRMLGIPPERKGVFMGLDNARNSLGTAGEAIEQASQEMLDFAAELIASKRSDPGDDLISQLVADEQTGEKLTETELLRSVRLLITAGHETTANQITLGVLGLLRSREQWQRLIDEPDLIPGAVEELLRWVSIFHISPMRVATADVELGGVRLTAGDGVIPCSAAANRDPDTFADPDRLDVGRDARGHVAFGFGIHQCLGQNLARVEIAEVLKALTSRIPSLDLAIPAEQVELRDYAFLSVTAAPVTWQTEETGKEMR
ncbi:cytochrome P450 [Enemella evansiae]|uniref:cytochrome P450 n=1 Tax=Enemella evansiae TaxID=2016499 RepID=UPI000B95CD38|nr:cytochrome P450 [Enemella evansiae]OYO19678.1 cytochrome P450 [Enemella evansiae]